MSGELELADGVTEWLGFADRLGPAQKRVILGLSAEWGPSPDHQTAKRMWYGVTGRGITRQRGPVYLVEHKHRTDNCWRLKRRWTAGSGRALASYRRIAQPQS